MRAMRHHIEQSASGSARIAELGAAKKTESGSEGQMTASNMKKFTLFLAGVLIAQSVLWVAALIMM